MAAVLLFRKAIALVRGKHCLESTLDPAGRRAQARNCVLPLDISAVLESGDVPATRSFGVRLYRSRVCGGVWFTVLPKAGGRSGDDFLVAVVTEMTIESWIRRQAVCDLL